MSTCVQLICGPVILSSITIGGIHKIMSLVFFNTDYADMPHNLAQHLVDRTSCIMTAATSSLVLDMLRHGYWSTPHEDRPLPKEVQYFVEALEISIEFDIPIVMKSGHV